MDFLSALRISASGLSAERARVNAASSNLANADSTRGPDGELYRRIDPVFVPEPLEGVGGAEGPVGVKVEELQRDEGPGRRVYLPSHPDADAGGFVTLPNVNPIHEVVNLMSAQRAYDANATAVETLKTMAQRALDIGR
ncbi:MAG: flagellar basal body rod protein FlgC [Myxococcota bacterium]|jgi:flagellar basal-body rod protein FlgC